MDLQKQLTVQTPSGSYPITWSSTFSELQKDLEGKYNQRQIFICTSRTLHKLYGPILQELFPTAHLMTVKDGEPSKSLKNIEKLTDHLLKYNADRNSLLVAIGGGVIGDLTGFLAATFMRGIDFIQIPTSLLAMVDSSVGGKTAVNSRLGKNTIGSFYQPKAVYICSSWLETLPDIEMKCGLAEALKTALIQSTDFIDFLQQEYSLILAKDKQALAKLSQYSIQIKAKVVAEDEKEKGIRAILNFGHTLAHGLETLGNYKKIQHGIAVSIGMVFATHLSQRAGHLDDENAKFSLDLLNLFQLPDKLPKFITKDKRFCSNLISAMMKDKKNKNGEIHFILLNKAGNALLPQQVNQSLLRETLQDFGAN